MARSNSLQGRLLAWVLGLVVLVWLVTAAMTWLDARHELDELLDSHLAQAAALLVVQQVHDLGEDDHQVDSPALHRYATKTAFQVFHEGRLVQRSANAPALAMWGPVDGKRTGFRTVSFDGTQWRVFGATGAERDVQVFVGEQVSSRNAILLAVLRSTLWPMLAALPVLALALWWAVRQGLQPLRVLGRVLGERSPQELRPVVVDSAPNEMAPALDALNGLLQRIAGLVESERRFTADAAHELRTPIAAIRAQAQVALGTVEDAERRYALASTLAGCDRAARLVDQLLTLSRLEAGAGAPMADVDLGDLARRVIADLAVPAIGKHQEIALDAADGCIVRGDATLLAVLVRNLVDNAIRYSPAHATVKVALTQAAGRVVLHVDDSGPGVAEEDMQRLGERFFRVLGSGQDGSGLGWSIIRRIAAAHQAQVRLGRSQALGGLAVEVEWVRQDALAAARSPAAGSAA